MIQSRFQALIPQLSGNKQGITTKIAISVKCFTNWAPLLLDIMHQRCKKTRGKLGALHSGRAIELYACLHESPRFSSLKPRFCKFFFQHVKTVTSLNIFYHSSSQVVGPNMIFVIGSASNTLSSK